MKLELIQYNAFFTLRRAVFIAILFGLISILISSIFFHIVFDFLKWGLLLLLTSWIFLNLFISQYKTIGTITITKDGGIIIQSITNEVIKKYFKTLRFYYGGYSGEMHEIEIFYTGSRTRDGTRNYFVIDGEEFQVLLKDHEELQLITSLIKDLENKGIDAKIVKKIKQ